MEKDKLMEIKKRLLALGLAGVMVGTVGCSGSKGEDKVPKHHSIPSKYSHVDDYYKYAIQNGEAVKLYNSENVYLLFDKETYEVTECIYHGKAFLGLATYVELYDLANEDLLVYSNGVNRTYNDKYYYYLLENNYQVCLADTSDYVEGHANKEFYSLDEIRELEPQIAQSLKAIDSIKVKKK